MIGILLALQVNNWNEWRKDRIKEADLIQQIHQEFLLNQEEIEVTISRNESNLKNTLNSISLFPIDQKSINRDTLHHYFNGSILCEISTFNPSSAVVNNIIQNNLINLIRNEDLRQRILTWHPMLDDYLEEEIKIVDFTYNLLIPYTIEKGIYKHKGFLDERVDLSFISGPEFENILFMRRDLFRRRYDRDILQKTINEIVELSSSN